MKTLEYAASDPMTIWLEAATPAAEMRAFIVAAHGGKACVDTFVKALQLSDPAQAAFIVRLQMGDSAERALAHARTVNPPRMEARPWRNGRRRVCC